MTRADPTNRPIRTLVLGEKLDLPERSTIAGLSRRGVELKVLLNLDADSGAADFLRDAGVAVEHLLCRDRIDPRAIRRIRRELEEGSFDVMHGLINRPLSCGLWAAWGNRDLKRVAYRGTEGHLSRFDPAAWMTYLHPRLDRIVCVSAAVERYLLGLGIPKSKLRVIYKGHDPAWYRAAERSRLTELGIPDGAFVVGCVANVRPVKGVEYLVRAWELLPPELEVHLLLIGEVRESKVEELLKSSPRCDRLHAIGFHREAAALQGACDLAAMVSVEREGLPRAILEAQAQGVPALVARVGGMPEIVTDGYNGFVVEPRDAAAIAGAITRAVADRAELAVMGERGREHFAGELGIEATIEHTLAMYRELVFGAELES